MKKFTIVLLLSFMGVLNAQYGGLDSIQNPDRDADFKVEASEMKYWSGDVAYYFNRGYSKSYFGVKFRAFVESFDENRDGKFSNLEFRRFQSGAKKIFSEALDMITLKYDENKNRRLDKSEKESARVEIENFLEYALSVDELKKGGEKAETIIKKDRAIDDIYD